MTNRREFIKKSAAMFTALPVFSENVFASPKDTERAKARFDPGMKLVRDGLEYAKKGKKNNRCLFRNRPSMRIYLLYFCRYFLWWRKYLFFLIGG